jgi:cellulose synthase/poly-beta-1,6-N-acetylglucosamine synthase-like glycosyltransferase
LAAPVWTSTTPVELPMLSGCCFLMRRSVLDEVGFFDPRFPLYFEDADLFRRITAAGRKLVHLPDAKLVHYYNRSGVTAQEEALRRFWISRRRYFEKWYGLRGKLLYPLSRLLAKSGYRKHRAVAPMEPITDLGELTAAPTLVLPRTCERFVVELAQDPSFLHAGGILGSGDRWTPSPAFWNTRIAESTFFFRVIDLTGERFEHLGTWSFTRVRGTEPGSVRRSREEAR